MRGVLDEWVVVGVGEGAPRGQFMMLNETGARLWQLLEQGAEEDTLAEALAREFRVDGPTARADAEAFVRRLVACGVAEAD